MATKTVVKLKITRHNLKGADDCGSDKSFSFIAGFEAEVTMKSATVVSDQPSPTLQRTDARHDPLSLFHFSSPQNSLRLLFLGYLIWHLLQSRLKDGVSVRAEGGSRKEE